MQRGEISNCQCFFLRPILSNIQAILFVYIVSLVWFWLTKYILGFAGSRVTLSENFDLGLGPAWDFTLSFFCINSMHQHHSPRSPPISPSSSIRIIDHDDDYHNDRHQEGKRNMILGKLASLQIASGEGSWKGELPIINHRHCESQHCII